MKLTEKAFLVRISVGLFDPNTTDKETTAKVLNEHQASTKAGRWRASTIPTDAPEYRALVNARTKVYDANKFYTSPWLDGGFRVLPSGLFFEWKRKVEEAADGIPEAADALIAALPALKQKAMAEANGLWNEALWPKEETIRKACWVTREYQPLPTTNDWRLAVSESEYQDIKAEAEESIKTQLMQAQENAISRLSDAVSHMRDRLKAYSTGDAKKLYSSMITNIEELVDVLPHLNLNDDPLFDTAINDCKMLLTPFAVEELKKSEQSRKFVIQQADDIVNRLKGIIG